MRCVEGVGLVWEVLTSEKLLNYQWCVCVCWIMVLQTCACLILSPPTQDENQPKSWWLKFEALCHYFSKTDSNSVLNLPKTLSETTPLDPTPTLNILTTMLTVATREVSIT